MIYICHICKEESVNKKCCRIVNGVLKKFCNRCGTVDQKKGWYNCNNFLLKKKKKYFWI